MTEKNTLSIWQRSRLLDRNRQQRQQELMNDYDRDVYYPAKSALRKECEEIGHANGRYHDNGLGWHWMYCGNCGARYNIEQHTKFTVEEDEE